MRKILMGCLLVMGGAVFGAWQQQDFLITHWCQPPATAENFAVLARDGYNLTLITPDAKASAKQQLDLAQQYGLKALVQDKRISLKSMATPAGQAQLAALIKEVKNHPALAGYFLTDEPSAVTFLDWARLTMFIKQRDPAHLAYINLYPCYANQKQLGVFLKEKPQGPLGIPDNFAGVGDHRQAIVFYHEYLRRYVAEIHPELISYDHYHFLKKDRSWWELPWAWLADNRNDGEEYFLNLEMIRTAALNANIPFLNIIQACTIEKCWRLVNEDELRFLAYTTMAYGGQGISWFLYWGPKSYGGMYQDGKRTALADDVAAVNRDIKALGPELMKMKSLQIYHSAPLPVGTEGMETSPVKVSGGAALVGMFQAGKDRAFMVVNRAYDRPAELELTFRLGSGKLLEFSLPEKQWKEVLTVTDGAQMKVKLLPGGGQLFKLVK